MNEQELAQFVEWLPSSIDEFRDKKPEEIVTILNKMSHTEEGMNTISGLINQFKQKAMFRSGGKISNLIDKFQQGGKNKQRYSDKVRNEFHNVSLFDYGPSKYRTVEGASIHRDLKPGTNKQILPNGVGLRQITRQNTTTSELVSPDKRDTLYINNADAGRVDSNINDAGVLGVLGLKSPSPVSSNFRRLQNIFGTQKFLDGDKIENPTQTVTSKRGNVYSADKADTTENNTVIRRLVGDIGNGVYNVIEQYQKVGNPNDLRYKTFNKVNSDYVTKLRKTPGIYMGPFVLAGKQDNTAAPLFQSAYNLNKK